MNEEWTAETQISEIHYALAKQIPKGFGLSGDYGNIQLSKSEYGEIEKLLIKLLNERLVRLEEG